MVAEAATRRGQDFVGQFASNTTRLTRRTGALPNETGSTRAARFARRVELLEGEVCL